MDLVTKKENKFLELFKKIFLIFTFFAVIFGLASCASVEYKGMSTNFIVNSCTYDSTSNTTEVIWSSTLKNQSIYDIKTVYFKFDLYKEGSFVETTDDIYWDISIKHGESDTSMRRLIVNGEIDNIKINVWNAQFSTFWETYEEWLIGTIIGIIVIVISFIVAYIITDGDVFELFEDKSWILISLLPFVIVLISSLLTDIATNWVPLCIVGGGIIAVAVLLLLFFILKVILQLLLIDAKSIILLIFGLIVIAGFICGCIFWKWWACLIILVATIALVALIISLLKIKKNHLKKENYDDSENDDADSGYYDNYDGKKRKKDKSQKKQNTGITFDDIAGLEEAKKAFKEKIILPFEHPEIYQKYGKKAGGGILLYGLPGTGKTMFAEAASNMLNATFIPVKCSDIKSKWYGESEQKVKQIFARAKRSKKAIIFFDEFEAIGAKRTDSDNGNNDLVPEILAEMQGIDSNKSDSTIMVIAATNKPWAIDSAFMRPGRFDEKIYIPLPDFLARKRLFELQLSKLPVDENLDYDYLAKITEGFNGADIKEVCEKLKMSAIKDTLNKGTEQTIGMDDVAKIEKSIKSSVSQEDVLQLKQFEDGLK
ncbi:MAG: AAA family ATPase [Erysipelotrichaceae bacterium]|nr:AAA family ATPase [Erysipelotrichaceae bacterium]